MIINSALASWGIAFGRLIAFNSLLNVDPVNNVPVIIFPRHLPGELKHEALKLQTDSSAFELEKVAAFLSTIHCRHSTRFQHNHSLDHEKRSSQFILSSKKTSTWTMERSQETVTFQSTMFSSFCKSWSTSW